MTDQEVKNVMSDVKQKMSQLDDDVTKEIKVFEVKAKSIWLRWEIWIAAVIGVGAGLTICHFL